MANYWGDDNFDAPRGRMRYGRPEYGSGYLDAGVGPAGRQRSRSTGQAQVPQINVYNRIENDHEQYQPYPPSRGASPRASPPVRYHIPHYQLRDEVVEGLAAIALDRERSRSRGRSDVSGFDRQAAMMAEWKLAAREKELEEAERRAQRERDEQRIREEMRYKYMKDEEVHRLEKQRADDELKAKMLAAELKAKKDKEASEEREKLWAEEYQRKQREKKDREKAEEQRIKDLLEREEREEKEKEERLFREFELKKQKEKDKKEAELKEAERILKEREEKKKQEERDAEEKFQNEMRARLRSMGMSDESIEIMVDKEKAKKFKEKVEIRTDTLNVWRPAKAPTYPKIHRSFVSIETLKYFDLPFEYDRTNSEYIIILRDMSKEDTDVLFEHTAKLRSGTLMLEGHKKKQPEYAWARKRSKSRHGHDKVSIVQFK